MIEDLEEFGLSKKAISALKRRGYYLVSEVVHITPERSKLIEGFGPKSMDQLEKAIKKYHEHHYG